MNSKANGRELVRIVLNLWNIRNYVSVRNSVGFCDTYLLMRYQLILTTGYLGYNVIPVLFWCFKINIAFYIQGCCVVICVIICDGRVLEFESVINSKGYQILKA